ncbi:Casein kinase I isoform delta [Perkinsus olseni]|uniref:Casein kinase I isoform delta n=1 Tax=Perkinsus olseni TaxID=32597 RepID=A0A7J6N6Z9_PEROL|nr:Casein kinase I isoform delta [Perkinsus olseni]
MVGHPALTPTAGFPVGLTTFYPPLAAPSPNIYGYQRPLYHVGLTGTPPVVPDPVSTFPSTPSFGVDHRLDVSAVNIPPVNVPAKPTDAGMDRSETRKRSPPIDLIVVIERGVRGHCHQVFSDSGSSGLSYAELFRVHLPPNPSPTVPAVIIAIKISLSDLNTLHNIAKKRKDADKFLGHKDRRRKLLEQDSRQRHRDHRHNAKHSAQLNVTTASSPLPGGATTSTTLPGGTTTSSFLPGGTTTSSFLPGGTTTSPSLPGGATTSTLATYPGSVAAAAWPQQALMVQPAATHAQQPRKGASSTAMYLDPSAVRPPISGDGSAADSKHFTIEFVRKFRCQRCLVHDHSTSKCAADKDVHGPSRCDQCGLHHDVPPNKVNCVASASTASSSLITIDLKISADDERLSPTVLCPALLDTGAEAFFLRSDELSSWRTAGLHFPILPDSTKVKGCQRDLSWNDHLGASFLILEDLTHRAIVPTRGSGDKLAVRGGVVGETPSEDRIFIGDAQVQQHSDTTASPGSAVNDLVAAGFAEIVDDPKQPDKATHPYRVCLDARELNRYLANISSKGVGPGSLWFFLIAIRNCKFFRAADLQTAFLMVGLHDSDSFFIGCVAASTTDKVPAPSFGLSCSGFGLDIPFLTSWQSLLPHQSDDVVDQAQAISCHAQHPTDVLAARCARCPMCSSKKAWIWSSTLTISPIAVNIQLTSITGPSSATVKLDDSGLPVHEVKTFDNIHPAPSLDPANVKGLLGYRYDPGSDSLSLSIKLEATYSPQSCTRRLLVGAPADAKIPPWDVPLDPTLIERLNKWISHIPRDLWVPRFAGLHQGVYAFTDASYDGFCCDIRAAESPFSRLCGRFGLFSLDCVHKHSIVQKELSGLYCTIILLDRLLDVATVHAIHRLRSIANDSKLGIFERRRLRRIGIGVSSSLASDLTYPRLSRPAQNVSDDDLFFDPIPLIDGSDSDVSCEINVMTTASNVNTDTHFVSVDELQADQESCDVIRLIKEKLASCAEDTTRQRLSNWYRINDDSLVVRILGATISDEDSPVVERTEQVLIGAEPLKHKLVEKAHDAFHRGKGGTFRLLSTRYYWKRMRAYVRRFVNRCEACAKAKGDRIARVLMIDYSGPYDGAFSGGQDPLSTAMLLPSFVLPPDTVELTALFDSTDWPSLILASDSTFRGHQWVHFCASNNILYKELPANAPFLLGSGERPHKEVNGYMRVIFGETGSRAWNLLPLPGSDIAPHDLVYLSRGRVPSLDPVDHSAARQVYQGLPSIVSALSPDILTDIQNVKVSPLAAVPSSLVRLPWNGPFEVISVSPGSTVLTVLDEHGTGASLCEGQLQAAPAEGSSSTCHDPDSCGRLLIDLLPHRLVVTLLLRKAPHRLVVTLLLRKAPHRLVTLLLRNAPHRLVTLLLRKAPHRLVTLLLRKAPPSSCHDPVPAEDSSSTCRDPPPAEDSSSAPREHLAPSAPRVLRSPDLGSLHVGMDVVAFFVPEDDAFGTDQQDGGRWYFGRLLSLDEEIPMIVIAPYCRRSDGLPVCDGEEYLAADSYLDHDSPTVIDLRSSFAVVRRITRATLRMLAAEDDVKSAMLSSIIHLPSLPHAASIIRLSNPRVRALHVNMFAFRNYSSHCVSTRLWNSEFHGFPIIRLQPTHSQ